MPAGKRAIPSFKKAPPDTVGAFEAAVAGVLQRNVRNVFGYPCLFVNGYMTAGLFGPQIFVRLSDVDAARLKEAGGKPLSVMSGRTMAGYTTIPKPVWSAPATLKVWVERAVAHSRSLPTRAPGRARKKGAPPRKKS